MFDDRASEQAWALSIAGRAAHLGGREKKAVTYYKQRTIGGELSR